MKSTFRFAFKLALCLAPAAACAEITGIDRPLGLSPPDASSVAGSGIGRHIRNHRWYGRCFWRDRGHERYWRHIRKRAEHRRSRGLPTRAAHARSTLPRRAVLSVRRRMLSDLVRVRRGRSSLEVAGGRRLSTQQELPGHAANRRRAVRPPNGSLQLQLQQVPCELDRCCVRGHGPVALRCQSVLFTLHADMQSRRSLRQRNLQPESLRSTSSGVRLRRLALRPSLVLRSRENWLRTRRLQDDV